MTPFWRFVNAGGWTLKCPYFAPSRGRDCGKGAPYLKQQTGDTPGTTQYQTREAKPYQKLTTLTAVAAGSGGVVLTDPPADSNLIAATSSFWQNLHRTKGREDINTHGRSAYCVLSDRPKRCRNCHSHNGVPRLSKTYALKVLLTLAGSLLSPAAERLSHISGKHRSPRGSTLLSRCHRHQ